MTELILTVEDDSMLASLRKVLGSIEGVTVKTSRKKKTGMELALEDVKAGRIREWEGSVDDMFDELMKADV